MSIDRQLRIIESLNYVVHQFYQVHYRGPWHMVIGTIWDPAVIHYDGVTAGDVATKAAEDLTCRGEAEPITPAQKSRERVRVAKATGVYRERIKQGPVKRPARVRVQSKKPFFS